MLLLAIDETCCGASKASRHVVAVTAGYGGPFEEVLQEGRLVRRRGWSRRENQGCGSEGGMQNIVECQCAMKDRAKRYRMVFVLAVAKAVNTRSCRDKIGN
jgi:hypothetical protein